VQHGSNRHPNQQRQADLSVTSFAITGTNASSFAQPNSCRRSVAAGAGCTISVTFAPAATGARSGALSISSNASGSRQRVALSGTGTAATPVAIPTFSIPSGAYTSVQTVTISNAEAGARSTARPTGPRPPQRPTHYAGPITVNSKITFEAIATASGYSTSAVAIATYTISLPITGLSLTRPAFGDQTLDMASAGQTVILSTAGNAALSTPNLAITGSNGRDFTEKADTCRSRWRRAATVLSG